MTLAVRLRRLAPAIGTLVAAACSGFLEGPGVSTNPNVPTTADPDQLWVGAQIAFMPHVEGLTYFQIWSEQLVGVNVWAPISLYAEGTTAFDANGMWDSTYGPGGLRDLRLVEEGAAAESPPNLRFRGEARVIEALDMGTAADIFGSVPYSTALTAHPTFDPQAEVYAHVLALLDSAIADLGSTGTGTASIDLFYANDFTEWRALASTLKARFLMHTARTNATTYDPTILALIVSATGGGIASATGDLQTNHTTIASPANINAFYYVAQGNHVEPSATHIALIKAAGEASLLPVYYVPNVNGGYAGFVPGQVLPPESLATFAATKQTSTAVVTYAENQMLLAEADFRLGNVAAAQATLDAYRATVGAPALGALTGASLLEAILREKYIHEFTNLEAWNDYLRTCYPNFPFPLGAAPGSYLPARWPVALDQQVADPDVPPQPPGNPGNPNDPKNDVAVDGSVCHGQVDRPF